MKHLAYLLILTICFAGCCNDKNQEKATTEMETKNERSAEFKNIEAREIPGNVIEMIADQWMLITVGNKELYNTMTAAWGDIGNIWGKPVSTCYIHPDRYTFEFIEKESYYTLCFFDEEYRQALRFCGSNSGRDYKEKNKAEEAGLTPAYTENGTTYFKEAYLVLECKKLYSDQFKAEGFATEIVTENAKGEKSTYNERETYHKFYIGEIVNCLMR